MPSVIDGAFIQAWPAAPGPGPLAAAFTRGPDIEVAGADFLDLVVRVPAIGAPTPLARVDIQLESVRNQGKAGAAVSPNNLVQILAVRRLS